ncbi:MAG: efflux RND transporter periplasmic adaptor subunit, partial [Cyclobacteriaceae bacterium]
MKILLKIFSILAGLALIILTGAFLYSKSSDKEPAYETTSPERITITEKVIVSGTIIPRNKVEIKPRVSGIVDKLFVEAGATVKKGDLIARISINPNQTEVSIAENDLEQARIAFNDAEREYNVQKKLYDNKIISQTEFSTYELAYNKARQSLKAAGDRLQLVKRGSLGNAFAATEVRATVPGTVLNIPVKVGGFVIETNTYNEGTTIASIANLDDMLFVGEVDEAEAGKLREGMDLELYIG